MLTAAHNRQNHLCKSAKAIRNYGNHVVKYCTSLAFH